MEEKKVKIGVFGCSRGSAVAACLKLAGAEIVAGCDSNPKALERRSRTWPRTACSTTTLINSSSTKWTAVC